MQSRLECMFAVSGYMSAVRVEHCAATGQRFAPGRCSWHTAAPRSTPAQPYWRIHTVGSPAPISASQVLILSQGTQLLTAPGAYLATFDENKHCIFFNVRIHGFLKFRGECCMHLLVWCKVIVLHSLCAVRVTVVGVSQTVTHLHRPLSAAANRVGKGIRAHGCELFAAGKLYTRSLEGKCLEWNSTGLCRCR